MERENVIKGLDICSGHGSCKNCGYHLSDGCSTMDCRKQLLRDALALLKEQEAKSIVYTDNPYTGLPVAHCPKCGKFASQFHSIITEETHYCPWCGQAVKWDD